MILLAGIVIILFASSINQLEFSPGVILRDPFENPQPNSGSVNWNEWNLYELWRIISTVILVVLLPMSVVYFILSKEARNRVIRSVVVLTLTVYALFIVIRNLGNIQEIDLFNNILQAGDASGDADQQITALANNEPSLLITIIASIIVALTIVSMAYWLFQRAQAANPPVDEINYTISKALNDIKYKRDIRNAIIRCYIDLQRIIEETHGKSRKSSMTPREFQKHLIDAGIQHQSIVNLTQLFEKARYSQGQASEAEETEAILHLKKIQNDIGRHAA